MNFGILDVLQLVGAKWKLLIIKELLKKEMGFDGLVITDALGMKAISEKLTPAEIAIASYKAGVDILLKPNDIIEAKGWKQISDEGEIKSIVLKILENNPQSIADYKAGKDKALGFLVGQAMKETRGKANPQMLNKMFLEELNK